MAMTKKYTKIYVLPLCLILFGCSSNIPIIKAYPRPVELKLYVSSAPSEIRARFATSLSLYYQGKLDSASNELTSLLTESPNYWGSYYYLGLISKDLGLYKTAIGRFREAIKLPVKEPGLRSNIYLALGECWESTGQFADAKRHYRAAININPESVPAKVSYNRVSQLIAQK